MSPSYHVALNKQFWDRSDWVKYLTLSHYYQKLLETKNPEILEAKLDEKFTNFVEKQVTSYFKGEALPTDIEAAVMNCADAFASGEGVILRSGDFISLQTYFRNQ